jgi:hypothetical protein
MNYGFPVLAPGGIYKGIQTEAMVSVPASRGRVIQGQGWAHDPSHVDYSQNCFLVHRTCKMGGADRDLADLLVDPMIAPSLSHEGVLQVLRQPGVPLFACALPAKMKTGAVNPQLCPTPAPPARTAAPPEKTNWGLVGVTVGLVGLTVAGFALALRHAGRAHA